MIILILAGVIVLVGALLYVEHRIHLRRHPEQIQEATPPAEEACCGMHITCERDSLLASVSEKIENYDDEELDRFAGVAAEDYTEDDIEEFRDVLLTTRVDDIAGWARSLQLRGIVLPQEIRDELLLIVSEARESRMNKNGITVLE